MPPARQSVLLACIFFVLFTISSAFAFPAIQEGILSESAPYSSSSSDDKDDDPTPTRDSAPKVFVDCGRCDFTFLRQEINYVNHVRDPQDADIHLLITNIRTGSGGYAYTLEFIGLGTNSDLNHVLSYASKQTDTSDETRRGLAQQIQLGLLPYVARTPLASMLDISFQSATIEQAPTNDPWNNWIFRINGSGNLNKESSRSTYRYNGSVSADRVTEDWRIRTSMYSSNDLRRFTSGDDLIESAARRNGISSYVVKSLTDHWSMGYSGSASSSTYSNLDLSLVSGPAVEYNIFPYSESTRREFTFAYRLRYRHHNYDQETIYNKTAESLLQHSLEARLRLKEKWGETNATIEGSHYLHDPSKSRLELSGNVYLRIVKGLSLRFSSGFELIHDQLYLAKGDASLEELLLQQRQLATTYEFSSSVGLSYTFGSIYNNVVNTRL